MYQNLVFNFFIILSLFLSRSLIARTYTNISDIKLPDIANICTQCLHPFSISKEKIILFVLEETSTNATLSIFLLREKRLSFLLSEFTYKSKHGRDYIAFKDMRAFSHIFNHLRHSFYVFK